MRTLLARRRRGERGAAARRVRARRDPVLLLILGGIINFGFAFSQKLALDNAVRQAARAAVRRHGHDCDDRGRDSAFNGTAIARQGERRRPSPSERLPDAPTCEDSDFGDRHHGDGHLQVQVHVPLAGPGHPDLDHLDEHGGVPVRVLMRRRARDEQGATLVLVALLATFLLVLSGFAVDFGQAYMSKRNLQKAADAGALAAAQVLDAVPGNVLPTSAPTPAAIAEAEAAADEYRTSTARPTCPRRPRSSSTSECDPALKVLVGRVRRQGRHQSSFGPLAGASPRITTDRRAEATVDVATRRPNQGVRPLASARCRSDAAHRLGRAVRPARLPEEQHHAPAGQCCPDPRPPATGGRWTARGAHGLHLEMVAQILNGCRTGLRGPRPGGHPALPAS